MKLVVRVDPRRDREGTLTLYDAAERVVFGPVPVCATADAALARRLDNAARDPLRPGGHPPFGTYRLVSVDAVDAADRREWGPQALSFEPTAGDALRAEGFGRLLLELHGGSSGNGGELRATSGGLRVADRVIEELAARLAGQGACELQLQPVRERWWSRLFHRRRALGDDDPLDREIAPSSRDSGSSEPVYSGRGGEFGGAGASGSWDSASSPRSAASSNAALAAGAAIAAGAVLAASESGTSTGSGASEGSGTTGDSDETTATEPAESPAADATSGTATETSY